MMGLSARVSPKLSLEAGPPRVDRRVIEIGIALTLSKFAIGLTLATGAAAVGGGSGPTPDGDVVIEPSALIA